MGTALTGRDAVNLRPIKTSNQEQGAANLMPSLDLIIIIERIISRRFRPPTCLHVRFSVPPASAKGLPPSPSD